MSKVTFDGERSLIIVDPGITSLDVREDLYSDWKRWFKISDNSKFIKAFGIVGGNPLPEDQLGLTYFLLGDWKIRPYEGDHRLKISGNLYKQDNSDPIADTVGDFKVTVSMRVSNLINMVGASGAISGGESCGATLDADVLNSITSQEEWSITAS